jgi:cytoplasmic iron level regulating protein YaaA (DUF328/UPF0246 family)
MLLVQSCSKSKNKAVEPVPALELYSGYFYKIIKKARRENDLRSDFDLCILSAEHGLIEPTTEITTYDRRMDAQRAGELAEQVTSELVSVIAESDHEEVVVNMGEEYRAAIDGVASRVDADIYYISGKLGERGNELKRIIRTSANRTLPTNAA